MSKFVSGLTWVADRTPDVLLRLLGRAVVWPISRRLDRIARDPKRAQLRLLRQVIARSRDTAFGKAHAFQDIDSFDSFRENVPIRAWDDFEPWMQRVFDGEANVLLPGKVTVFGETSGTSGRSKLFPYGPECARDRMRALLPMIRVLAREAPRAILGLRMRSCGKTPRIDEQGRVIGSPDRVMRHHRVKRRVNFQALPMEIFDVQGYGTRVRLILLLGVQRDLRLLVCEGPLFLARLALELEQYGEELVAHLRAGTLGTDLVLSQEQRTFFEQYVECSPALADRLEQVLLSSGQLKIRDLWPNLAAVTCWSSGVSRWHLAQLRRSLGDVLIVDFGLLSTEAFLSAPLVANSTACIGLADQCFLEFIECGDGKKVRFLHEIQEGGFYEVLVTTMTGLFRYRTMDIVKVVGRYHNSPLFEFCNKTSGFSSIAGEKIAECQVVAALEEILSKADFDANIVDCVMAPIVGNEAGLCQYVLALGSRAAVPSDALQEFAQCFDLALRRINERYDYHRGNGRLDLPVAVSMSHLAFDAARAARRVNAASDGRVKLPHLDRDGSVLLELGFDEIAPILAERLPVRMGLPIVG